MNQFESLKLRKGFTLIELLVVIAIIVIIAALIIINLATARTKARDSRRVQDLDTMRTAVESYIDENSGTPPGTVNTTYHSATTPAWENPNTNFRSALVPSLLSALPLDPRNGILISGTDSYRYAFRHNGSQYELNTILERNTALAIKDGGSQPATGSTTCSGVSCQYEIGTNLTLIP